MGLIKVRLTISCLFVILSYFDTLGTCCSLLQLRGPDKNDWKNAFGGGTIAGAVTTIVLNKNSTSILEVAKGTAKNAFTMGMIATAVFLSGEMTWF